MVWAEGDSNLNWKPPADYGQPKSTEEAADAAAYKAADGYGLPGGVMTRPGMTKGAAVSYLDTTESDAFKKRLSADLAALGGRATPTAGATRIGAGGYMNAAHLGPAAQYGGASLNLANDAQIKAKQNEMAAALRARAAGIGNAPGVDQLHSNLNSSLAAMNSAAASARGRGNAGMAARALAGGQAAAQQGAVSDEAILRAQDQQMAQGALANLYTSGRAADFTGAETAARFGQDASMFNADAFNKFGLARAGFGQTAGLTNASTAQTQAEMDQQVKLSNMEATLRAQGLDDKTIAMRMGMYQDQINQEKQNQMAFWGYASGNRQFDATMDYAREAQAAANSAAQFAAAGSAVGTLGTAYAAGQKNQPTSDWREKTNVRPAAPVLAHWLDQLGGR